MSVKIGNVEIGNGAYQLAEVWADAKGVRVMPLPEQQRFSLSSPQDPVAARNFAALLVRAADEVERMRALLGEK